MKAWILDALEGIGRLKLAEVADPRPGSGEVVLKVSYAALNPADRYLAEAQYPAKPSLPHILGRDGYGTVVEVGTDVSDIGVGEHKTILRGETGVSRWGTLAEKVVVSADSLVDPPAHWTELQSASAALVYLTAWQALMQWGELKPSVVLITGASGGVGVAGLQLGRALGHTMIALSRGESKVAQLKQLGAHLVLDPANPVWRKQLKEALQGRRVDLAIDNIGGQLFNELMETLGEWGKVSVVGRLAGPVPQFNTSALLFRRVRVGGVAVGSYSVAESGAAWTQIVATLARAGAVPVIDKVFPFDNLPDAFARLKEGPMGKVVIAVGGTV